MTREERRAWYVAASLFVSLFLVFGSGYNTAGVFITPLIRHFGWDRAKVSSLQSVLAISAGLSAPLVGWLLDKVQARILMAIGAGLSGIAFLMASRATSFGPMVVAYLVLGVGIGAATLLPASLVIANWFGARRGLAMGLTMAGTSTGGMVMTIVAGRLIAAHGWRVCYVALAAPMLVVAVPLAIVMVRTRPPTERKLSVTKSANALPGLEVGAAIRTRSFWMVAAAQFFFAFTAAAAGLHLIPYLIDLGYKAENAATVMGVVLGLAALGKLVMGPLADRIGGRTALGVNFLIAACGMVLIFGAGRVTLLIPFMIVFGLSLGAPLALVPLVIAESLGLKRFGSIAGLTGVCNTIGAALGPVVAGRIFDVTHSYAHAFELFFVLCVLGAVATFLCRPLAQEEQRGKMRLAATA